MLRPAASLLRPEAVREEPPVDHARFIALSTSFAYFLLVALIAPYAMKGTALAPLQLAVDVGISACGGLAYGIVMRGLGRYRRKRSDWQA